jgi:hypothetical protein
MRRHAGLFVVASAVFIVAFAVFLRVQPESDLDLHLRVADRIHGPGDITFPHFLLHLLIKGWVALGVPARAGLAVLLGVCYGAMALLIAREAERRGARLSTGHLWLVTLALLLAAHVFLPTALRRNFYYGYFVPVVYHNPTQQLCKLFALWIWFRYCRDFLAAARPPWRSAIGTGGLCVISALAKPSFLIAFLPLAGVIGLWDLLRWRVRRVLVFGIAIALPATAVLLTQAVAFYGAPGDELLFAPFAVFNATQTLYKLPLSLLFPLAVLALSLAGGLHFGDGTDGQRASLRAAWGLAAIALFATLCLAERSRLADGNFAWTGQTAVFLLYVESALALACRPAARPARVAGWAAFGLHVVSGVIWYAAVFFPERVDFL